MQRTEPTSTRHRPVVVGSCVSVPASAKGSAAQWGGIASPNFGSWGDGDTKGRLCCSGSDFISVSSTKLETAVQPRPASKKLLRGSKMIFAPVPAPQTGLAACCRPSAGLSRCEGKAHFVPPWGCSPTYLGYSSSAALACRGSCQLCTFESGSIEEGVRAGRTASLLEGGGAVGCRRWPGSKVLLQAGALTAGWLTAFPALLEASLFWGQVSEGSGSPWRKEFL